MNTTAATQYLRSIKDQTGNPYLPGTDDYRSFEKMARDYEQEQIDTQRSIENFGE